jgi:hypothetical protein
LQDDKAITKTTSPNLDTVGSIASGGDYCCPDSGTEKSNPGVVAATGFKDISFPNQIYRHINI